MASRDPRAPRQLSCLARWPCWLFHLRAWAADPVKAEATLSSGGGYARLVVKFAEDVTSEVVTAGSIIVIRFERPVDVDVDKVADAVPDYVGSARRDPDGSAIRLSLSRKVTINTMTAGERLFVDLLPDSWNGPPPSLPQEVVRELAERARAAERELRQQRAMSEAKKRAPVRVRASVQPTFVRFIFEMPDGVGVSSVLNEQKLKLLFSKALTFDLADAKISAPQNVSSISQKIEGETAVVELVMLGDVDVHSFREDRNYVIDVAFQQADKPAVLPQAADAAHAPPARVAEKPHHPCPRPCTRGSCTRSSCTRGGDDAGSTSTSGARDGNSGDDHAGYGRKAGCARKACHGREAGDDGEDGGGAATTAFGISCGGGSCRTGRCRGRRRTGAEDGRGIRSGPARGCARRHAGGN